MSSEQDMQAFGDYLVKAEDTALTKVRITMPERLSRELLEEVLGWYYE